MSEIFQSVLIVLVPALMVAVITAYVTVKLATRQFYSQRWWEKKAEAYSHIIEHLANMQYYFEEMFDEGIGDKTLSEEEKDRLLKAYRQAKESITRAVAIGAYIVSDGAVSTLEEFLRQLGRRTDDWIGDLDTKYALVKECIASVREYAEADLRKK